MKHVRSSLSRGAVGVALLALLAACGSHSGTSSAPAPVSPQAVTGVATPAQFSVVTAK